MTLAVWWAPRKQVASVTWRGALRRGPGMASVEWGQQKARDHAASAEKIGQQRVAPSGRMTLSDRREN